MRVLRNLANTPAFLNAQRERKKVEALFAELKNQIGLRRLRLRRLKFVREQFFLAAAAQNIKRLVRFLSQRPQPPLPATISLRSQNFPSLRLLGCAEPDLATEQKRPGIGVYFPRRT